MGLVNLGRLGSDTQLTRRLLLLSLTSFALLILAGAAAIHMAGRSAEAERWIVHTLDVRKEARALMVDLLDGETSVRGFVLTRGRALPRAAEACGSPICAAPSTSSWR